MESRKKIDGQKEICLKVDDYEKAKIFLQELGFRWKNFQESKREIWNLDDVEICLDEWPFLEPFLEIEGCSEKAVKKVCEKLGFDYSAAKFCAAGDLYAGKYDVSVREINESPKIIFDMDNPFIK